MVVESESVERRRRRRRRQKGRKGVSDSSGDNDKKLLILLQVRQTDIGSGEDALYTGRPRRLNTSSYYILDLHNGTVSTLARTVQDREGSLSPPVGMGSRIYIFASKLHDADDPDDRTSFSTVSTYFLDLTNPPPQPCWKKCAYPPLTNKDQLRLDASVAFRGKFYFFRGSYSSCLCEVFDPPQYDDDEDNNSSSSWHRIKSPPGEHLELTPPVLPDYKNNRIIVCFTNISAMYAYYPSQDRWECLVEGFHGWFSSLDPVTLVDGVIYIHGPEINGFFKAYDIATKQWLDVQVSPAFLDNFESYLHLYSYGSLLHLGDAILCLLGWTYEDNDDESGQSQTTSVHVVQFKVELIRNNNDTKEEVLVTPLSSKYYPLNSRCQVRRYLRL